MTGCNKYSVADWLALGSVPYVVGVRQDFASSTSLITRHRRSRMKFYPSPSPKPQRPARRPPAALLEGERQSETEEMPGRAGARCAALESCQLRPLRFPLPCSRAEEGEEELMRSCASVAIRARSGLACKVDRFFAYSSMVCSLAPLLPLFSLPRTRHHHQQTPQSPTIYPDGHSSTHHPSDQSSRTCLRQSSSPEAPAEGPSSGGPQSGPLLFEDIHRRFDSLFNPPIPVDHCIELL